MQAGISWRQRASRSLIPHQGIGVFGIAKAEGVILVKHDQNGYGRAYLEAFPLAHGRYIFMADADGTYDFHEIPNFLNALKIHLLTCCVEILVFAPLNLRF